MLKPILIFAIVIAGYFYTRQSNASHGTLIDTELPAEIIGSGKPVLVDFWMPSCGSCVALGPTIDALKHERKDLHVAKINTDEKREVAQKFKIRSFPCLVLFKDGKEVDRIAGGVSKSAIEAMIAKHH